ncbi:MAG TPA: prolipoprotein diacylglyceryl transferase [Patescibacteria group bacterium]|nr:prolipoprotein diacylglyceryl transferase [Patescibacteria group bacterium]
MTENLNFYQHLPQYLNPNISFGFMTVSWYSVMYLVAFLVVYLLVKYRIKKGENNYFEITNSKLQISNKIQNPKLKLPDLLVDFLLYSFIGLIIGARLGEVLFYNFPYYAAYPLRIISPFDPLTHKFVGIYGMSYHGGLIGAIIAAIVWTRVKKIDFWSWINFIVPAIPAGYFFGRVGNFINGELYGRITDRWWGMYFPGDRYNLRQPSQILEAVLEGLLLFIIFWPMRNNSYMKKYGLAFYMAGYALFRFLAEFFREPDGWVGIITIGQLLSLAMLASSLVVFFLIRFDDIIREGKQK